MDDGDETPTLSIGLRHPVEGWNFGRAPEASVFWSWYETIKKWGADHAYEMAAESALLGKSELTDSERTYLRRWLLTIEWHGDRRPDREAWARQISYTMLACREWNRHEAARFAANVLGRDIKESTWRTAVDKWASAQGKPKLALPHGRPVKNKAQDS
jgi:hypothetical protein